MMEFVLLAQWQNKPTRWHQQMDRAENLLFQRIRDISGFHLFDQILPIVLEDGGTLILTEIGLQDKWSFIQVCFQ